MKKCIALFMILPLFNIGLFSADHVTKRKLKIKLELPIIDVEYERSWRGNNAKSFCPEEKPYNCEYTVKISCLKNNNVPPGDTADVEVEIDMPDSSKFVALKLIDCLDTPGNGSEFIMHTKVIAPSDSLIISGTLPFTMFFPEQEMIFVPEIGAFVGYFYQL